MPFAEPILDDATGLRRTAHPAGAAQHEELDALVKLPIVRAQSVELCVGELGKIGVVGNNMKRVRAGPCQVLAMHTPEFSKLGELDGARELNHMKHEFGVDGD